MKNLLLKREGGKRSASVFSPRGGNSSNHGNHSNNATSSYHRIAAERHEGGAPLTAQEKEIAVQAMILEDHKDSLMEIHDKLKQRIESAARLVDEGRSLSNSFLDYAKKSDPSTPFGECLVTVGNFQSTIESMRHHLDVHLMEVFGNPVKDFVDFDVNDALLTKVSCEQAKSAQDQAEQKIARQTKEKQKNLAVIEYNKARFKYERIQEVACKALVDTNQKSRTDMMEKLCDYLDAYKEHFSDALNVLTQMSTDIAMFRMQVQKERAQEVKRREQERQIELEQRRNLEMEQQEFKSRKEKEERERKERERTAVFGVSLQQLMEREGISPPHIPSILDKIINHLEQNGADKLGLFRVTGSAAEQRELINSINAGEDVDLAKISNIHVVAEVLKKYLRQLQNPLLTFALWDDFMGCVMVDEGGSVLSPRTSSGDLDKAKTSGAVSMLKATVAKLPPAHFALARRIIRLCVKISAHADVNKMTASNLAALFGPNILLSEKLEEHSLLADMKKANLVIELMITFFEDVFGPEPVSRNPEKSAKEGQTTDKSSGEERGGINGATGMAEGGGSQHSTAAISGGVDDGIIAERVQANEGTNDEEERGGTDAKNNDDWRASCPVKPLNLTPTKSDTIGTKGQRTPRKSPRGKNDGPLSASSKKVKSKEVEKEKDKDKKKDKAKKDVHAENEAALALTEQERKKEVRKDKQKVKDKDKETAEREKEKEKEKDKESDEEKQVKLDSDKEEDSQPTSPRATAATEEQKAIEDSTNKASSQSLALDKAKMFEQKIAQQNRNKIPPLTGRLPSTSNTNAASSKGERALKTERSDSSTRLDFDDDDDTSYHKRRNSVGPATFNLREKFEKLAETDLELKDYRNRDMIHANTGGLKAKWEQLSRGEAKEESKMPVISKSGSLTRSNAAYLRTKFEQMAATETKEQSP